MKRLFVFIFITFLTIFTACITGDNGKDKDRDVDKTFAVSGYVIDKKGAGISSITVTLAGETISSAEPDSVYKTGSTNKYGKYLFTDVSNGNYIVIPYKLNCTFTPEYRTITVNGANEILQSFTVSYGSGDAGTHLYYPMKTGTSWLYSYSGNDYDDEDPFFSGTYLITIIGTEVLSNGSEYWIFFDEDMNDTVNMRIDNEIVYLYSAGWYEKAAAKITGAAKSSVSSRVFSALKAGDSLVPDELPYYKLNVEPGTKWELFSFSEESGTTTMTAEYIGTENVTIDSGTFENCKKFRTFFTYVSPDYTYTRETYRWLAPDVGEVRISLKDHHDAELTIEEDDQIVSWEIPQ
ncbi:hypothetical protein ACFL1R_04660 [Candidatus Latescibacterota bacterium]